MGESSFNDTLEEGIFARKHQALRIMGRQMLLLSKRYIAVNGQVKRKATQPAGIDARGELPIGGQDTGQIDFPLKEQVDAFRA